MFSAIFQIVVSLTGVKNANRLLYDGLYTFIVLALAEEIAKYRMFRRMLKKTDYPVSWLDVTALMQALYKEPLPADLPDRAEG